MIKKLPNIICWFRIALIPFVLLFLLDTPVSESMAIKTRFLVSGILFAVAILSDFVDGKIARKFDAVTNFGKFLDPIADKLLVLGVLCAFIELGFVSCVPVLLILAREFMITGLRLGAMSKGEVVAANWWGKVKTALQGVSLGLFFIYGAFISQGATVEAVASDMMIPQAFFWLVSAYTVISVVPYYMACRKYLKD
ncbi:MAG: CDP-diacylglycerol--glycerol-3-phosphate 3-phosphatidyltransferase [Clostridia bacterium]|nr:CDP-diacylglycerol--glycerol-3-phosphate 3-phosphatidyltransferase [Clostridia bacterium]